MYNRPWIGLIFFIENSFRKDLTNFYHRKITLKEQILRCSRRLFIILVSLMMTWFSDKCLFSLDAYMVSCPTWSKNLGRTLRHTHETEGKNWSNLLFWCFLQISDRKVVKDNLVHLYIIHTSIYNCGYGTPVVFMKNVTEGNNRIPQKCLKFKSE